MTGNKIDDGDSAIFEEESVCGDTKRKNTVAMYWKMQKVWRISIVRKEKPHAYSQV